MAFRNDPKKLRFSIFNPCQPDRSVGMIRGVVGRTCKKSQEGYEMTDGWEQDLSSIGPSDWTPERARHLLDRAGFGGPPEQIARLAAMSPEAAVASFVDFKAIDDSIFTTPV
jgi:hypothetical protein